MRIHRRVLWPGAALALLAAAVAVWEFSGVAPTPTPAPQTAAPPAAPNNAAADIADGNLAVSWSPVPEAAGYLVAARFANGVEPLAWTEYEAEASPYVITDSWAAMSGLEYEVRVAAVNAAGQSAWSAPVVVKAPELLAAPADAIRITTKGPYAIGDIMEVDLASQRPFTRRSPFVWALCSMDESSCALLPIARPSTFIHLVSEAARGKRVRVQADYDKDGLSYTAASEVGIVSPDAPDSLVHPVLPPGCEEIAPSSGPDRFTRGPDIPAHLHLLESKSIRIERGVTRGGAAEPLCNDLLVVTSWGGIALVAPDGRVEYVEGDVPMNLESLRSHPDSATFEIEQFRVADILLKQRTEEVWELFVTHHYFTGECTRFRLSSTTITRNGALTSASPSWRTIFDAEPCLPPDEHSGDRAGGEILADGPDHLLVGLGDHSREDLTDDPGSHLGKLVRVGIETGEAETLAAGFRNPQGFVRDREGNLWQTEHGPQGGDELNLIEPGADYGWPSVSYGVEYDLVAVARANDSVGTHEGYVKPRFSWVPSIAVSAIIVNDARWFPLWKDDLLIASLTGANSSGLALFRVRRDGVNVRYVERIEVGYRIRDLTMMPDGRIALLDDVGGVHFLSRSLDGCDAREDERLRRQGQPRPIYHMGCGAYAGYAAGSPLSGKEEETPAAENGATASATPPPLSGAQLYAPHCGACHSLRAKHGVGPHLAGLIGRPIGEVEGWSASQSLRSLDGVWTAERLAQFLADPQAFAPGAAMGTTGITEAEARAIADYVAGLRGE